MAGEEKRDFDSKAARWDEEPRRVKLAGEVVEALKGALPLAPTMEALDYGCGSGLVTLGLQPLVARITGADSSKGMLEVLGGKVAERGIDNVATQFVDLEEDQRLAGSFDLIVSSMTMHHVADVPALVAAFVESLRPGGWLALADLEREDGSFHEDPTGVRHHGFDRDYFPGLYSRNGLSEIRVVTASTIEKKSPAGETRAYPVVLAVARKPL